MPVTAAAAKAKAEKAAKAKALWDSLSQAERDHITTLRNGGAVTLGLTVNGVVVATGPAIWTPSKSSHAPNLNIGGKIDVAGVYCQLGVNITEILSGE